jgi:hypothetical protein
VTVEDRDTERAHYGAPAEPAVPALTLLERASGRSLVVEGSNPGDIDVEMWVADPDDGRSVLLTLAQVRVLHRALADRLELLEDQR